MAVQLTLFEKFGEVVIYIYVKFSRFISHISFYLAKFITCAGVS